MTVADPTFAYVCAALSVPLLALSLAQRRKQRLLADLPTSKTHGVFIGLVELAGTAESPEPLRGFLHEGPCVCYEYSVEEEWSRTVTETYTDSDGKTKTRTRVESGWTTVANDREAQDFYLRDETGSILIRPARAKLEPTTVFNELVSRADPLYYGKGPASAVADSRHRRRFLERAIPLHAPLFIVGQARERDDIVAPEIAFAPDAPLFLISTRTEKSVQRGHAVWSWVTWALGLIAAVAGGLTAHPESPLLLIVMPATYLALWGLTWTWMVFNSLVGLRARVRQAWSLIDVQLKRRHDLIPNLVTMVGAIQTHEQATQTAVATLRAQLTATAPGVAGPDFEGVIPPVRAVVEKYPELRAQKGFSQLFETLVETEQRIALARSYYNDIATHFATRLERVPDGWVAALARMKPEPLLAATTFERANVQVDFASS